MSADRPPIYADHNATTPLDPAVLEAMLPYLRERFGNPSSLHRAGAPLRRELETARLAVAELIGATPPEIVFTSGGTESNNTALRGACKAQQGPMRIVTSRVEHPSVLNVARHLRDRGADLDELPVDAEGRLDPARLEAALDDTPAIISLMWANNETGVLFPMSEIALRARTSGAFLHTDAIQAVGKIPVNVDQIPVDALSLSGHKLYGPKGIGALFIRRGSPLVPLLQGGLQENGRRAGTENVAGIIGLGEACRLAAARLPAEESRLRSLRDRLETGLVAQCAGAVIAGASAERLPNTLNIRFRGVEGDSLLLRLDEAGIAVSSGSACSSGRMEPSHVLLAMGVRGREAGASIRFSLGRGNTEADVDAIVAQTAAIVAESTRGRR